MAEARYDAVADFYEAGWRDANDDPVSGRLFDMLGEVGGVRVLDLACGHGRIARELARRGAHVTGVDISTALIRKAQEAELVDPLGIRYVHADVASSGWWNGPRFDRVVCNFGLSDIDDLDGAVANVAAALRPGGRFLFSILHPCFPGGQYVSGSWPSGTSYYEERWWSADGALSTLRRQVGANHRMLSTYVNTLTRHGFHLDELLEPPPPPEWASEPGEPARFPVFLVANCLAVHDGQS